MTDSYRISHRAPSFDEEGTTVRLDQVGGAHDQVFPRDVFEHPDWYGGTYDETIRQVRAAAQSGDPDRLVTVYRAVPLGVTQINPGDWVALSRSYAVDESYRSSTDGSADGNVITARTPARTLYSEGYLEEWGYQGDGPLTEAADAKERSLVQTSFPRSARAAVSAPLASDAALPPTATRPQTMAREASR